MAPTSLQVLGAVVTLLHVEPGVFSLLEWPIGRSATAPPRHLHGHTDEAV